MGIAFKEMVKPPTFAKPSEKRSKIMSAVRQRGTTPELAVRRILSGLGMRYRLNVPDLPGRPDIANRSQRLAIFVHGCFWHRHANCRRATTPKENRKFWVEKFHSNVERDKRNAAALRRLNFTVLTVWECETAMPEVLRQRLRKALEQHVAGTTVPTSVTRRH